MRKIRLDLDSISVDSFEVTREPGTKGTVRGHVCCACCCCDPCCCTCCDTCQATCPNTCLATCGDTCQTCDYSCWGTCGELTCLGRSCDYCLTDACTYQIYGGAGVDGAMMIACY
ncbi:MAG TPA: hypothetical protein VF771_17855 [Longimicrobiaceae bacterium]